MFLKLNWGVFDLLLDDSFDVCWMLVYSSLIWRIYCWIFYGWLSRCFGDSVIAVWLNICWCCGPCWCVDWCRCGHFVLMMRANYVSTILNIFRDHQKYWFNFYRISKLLYSFFSGSPIYSEHRWCLLNGERAIDVYCSSRRAAVESCRMLQNHVGVTNL